MKPACFTLAAMAVAIGCRLPGECSPGGEKGENMTPQTTAVRAEIRWLPWGSEAFDRAAKEDKLILADSGATWCHWCHVMDRVTYEDAELGRLVNERFVPVRIDRDRLPDVDAWLQREPAMLSPMGEAGGWPLTVLLTPEGHVLMKATFLPPRAGGEFGASMGLIDLLGRVDTHWRQHRQELRIEAVRREKDLAARYAERYSRPGPLRDELLDELRAGLSATFDEAHGGFGTAPKFFSTGALELLLARAWAGDERASEMLATTLEAMARGGVCDQVGGGFHRYSVDARWHVPHFEKMAGDNAELLALYADAYALTGREEFAETARRSLAWIDAVLRDQGGAGFFASQDADVGLDDDGDYFTWTPQEVRGATGPDAELAISCYGVDEAGDLPGRPGRNVLRVTKTPRQLAALLQRDEAEVAAGLARARAAMQAARQRRTAPAVDRTVFADLNGMMIDAHLTASERLGEAAAREQALAALDWAMEKLRDERGVFAHYRSQAGLERVGLLSDQAWMARALLHAYCLTGRPQYLDAACIACDYILADLRAGDGGLADRPASQPAGGAPIRSWEDSPTRSSASVAAQALMDAGYLTGRGEYTAAARAALESFAGSVERSAAVFLGGYGVAAERLLHGPRSVVVIGPAEAPAAAAMLDAARKSYIPGAIVLGANPAAAPGAELLHRLHYEAAAVPAAYVCSGASCLAPARTAEQLARRLEELRRLAARATANPGEPPTSSP